MIPVPATAERNIKSATVRNRAILFSLLSGVLLFLSYPPFSLGFLAWAAFLPLFFALEYVQARRIALLTGWVAGFAFFFVSIQWLTHVTVAGWILLAAFESLFVAGFAFFIYESRHFPPFLRIIWISLAWTSLEFLRAKFPVLGFGWNLLGYSQAFYKTIAQTANTVGAYGLGCVIAAVNAGLYECSRGIRGRRYAAAFQAGAVVFLLLFLTGAHGIYHQSRAGKSSGQFRITVLQGNIPQAVKWEVMARSQIIQIYSKLTELSTFDEPSLIIWPEAAFPGYFNKDFDAQTIQDLVQKIETPVLLGAPHWENEELAYNSAYLLGPDGEIKQRYDKQNLVPFGEYVPLKFLIPGLEKFAYSLGVSDFSAGHDKTVFSILNHEVSFSTLICFEDTFPELARDFVNRGAQFLAVITNDAWFGYSGAAAQHLQASIFRAIENGVPVVRAANTGISAFISNRGQVLGRVTDERGRALFVTGRKTMELPLEMKDTLFRDWGWFFPYGASLMFVIMLGIHQWRTLRI